MLVVVVGTRYVCAVGCVRVCCVFNVGRVLRACCLLRVVRVYSEARYRRPCALNGCFLDLAVLWEEPVPLVHVTVMFLLFGRRGLN